MVFRGGMGEDHLRAPADHGLGQTDAVRGVQERQIGPDCRVEHFHWSRSSSYGALIGGTLLLLCWCQGLCHNNTPQGK